MQPRWRSEPLGTPLLSRPPGDRSPSSAHQAFFAEPLPDLEQQLAAELGGASWAVVAFVPENVAWCDWIYRNINGYPLPVSLVDRVTPHGFPRPDCLSIFPDRRDPAYEEHIPRALENSAYLIVVCSRYSAQSVAVAAQIRAFKKAGGEERIIALVVDGPPDLQLGTHLRAAACDWLPVWLAWRLEENGFRAADRSEPRIVDARRGYRSLKQVRDSLLAALVDMDAGEFERLGGCARPIESVASVSITPDASSPEMTPALTAAPPEISQQASSKYTICTAVILILVAVIFGTRSFLEITSDEPVSTLEVGPVTGALPGRAAKARSAEEDAFAAAAAAAAPEAEPAPVVAQPAPTAVQPVVAKAAPAIAEPRVAAPAPPVPQADVAQVPPSMAFATSRILPPGLPSPEPASTAAPVNSENDAVLLDEVRTLERRGDETMAEKRTEDALDLYSTALVSAQEYAARKGSNPAAKDQVFNLMRKLGLLQLQNSSTAEARSSYTQARKVLLQLKQAGTWSRERAKELDEIESRLLSLPRD